MTDLISRQAAIDYCYQLINVEYQQGSDEMNYVQERVSQTETILHHLEFMPSAQTEPHYCRGCKWSRCHINADKHGKSETYWWCLNWDGETDEEGYCHEWERRTDERLQIRRHDRHSA